MPRGPLSLTRAARTLCKAAVAGVFLTAPLAPALAQAGPTAAESAQSAPSLTLELNGLQQADAACRMTFVVRNDLGSDLETAGFEFAFFSTEGAVERLTVLDFQDLPQGKTKVTRFDLPSTQCASIGRVLVNTATNCKGPGLDAKACMKALKTENRTSAEFGS